MKKIISALLILVMMFSIVCVSASAASIHIDMNFDSVEQFNQKFRAGAFYMEDGKLFGYAEAKALQSEYDSGDDGIFDPHPTCWLTYDASVTIAIGDDELSEDYRHVNIVYCNDNLYYNGRAEGRVYISFRYDVEKGCFTIAEGINDPAGAVNYVEPVPMEIPVDAEEEFTMGISVQKDNIRCFYNDQMIYDYTNPDLLIANEIVSPFVFWQEGNFTTFSNITIGEVGSIYPVSSAPAPAESTTPKETTTATSIVKVTDDQGNDVTDDSGNVVTETVIITEPPVADTNTGAVVGGNSTTTGDVTFIVVAAMVATLGCALIIKKVSVK